MKAAHPDEFGTITDINGVIGNLKQFIIVGRVRAGYEYLFPDNNGGVLRLCDVFGVQVLKNRAIGDLMDP